jgi:hypothetical protein
MVYGETFQRNFKFYAKTLTKLHDLTVHLFPLLSQRKSIAYLRGTTPDWLETTYLSPQLPQSESVHILSKEWRN